MVSLFWTAEQLRGTASGLTGRHLRSCTLICASRKISAEILVGCQWLQKNFRSCRGLHLPFLAPFQMDLLRHRMTTAAEHGSDAAE